MKLSWTISTSLKLTLCLSLLAPLPVFAHLISITGIKPFPAQVLISSTTTATYAVNNISKIPLTPIDQSQLPNTFVISSSTCGRLIGPGKSCKINLRLNAPAVPTTLSTELRVWAKPSRDGVRHPITVGVIEHTQPIPLTAVGQNLTGSEPPLLVVSPNGGKTWDVKTITHLTTHGYFVSASCTGSGSSAICTAAGQDLNSTEPPLLAVSTDGAKIWKVKTITHLPRTGFFNATSCTGSGSNAICTAAGDNQTGTLPPFLAASTDGGNTWEVKTITNLPTSGFFDSTSCTGDGSNAICTAAGEDLTDTQPPLLVVSTDGGNFWEVKTIPHLTTDGVFHSTSCTGSAPDAICIAAGKDFNNAQPPLLVASINGGNTWEVKAIDHITNGEFFGTSCTGSGSSAVCTAVGQDLTGAEPPLITVSTDGAKIWKVKAVTNLPITGVFNAASCTGVGSRAICIAAGQDLTGTQPPLLAVSTDGGDIWTVKTIANLPITGVFNAASCTGNGAKAICTASGQDLTGTEPPLLVISTDGGNTWGVQAIANLPIHGDFLGSAATGSKKLNSKRFGAKNILKGFVNGSLN